MVATLGPEAWPPPPLEEFAAAIDQPRHLHPLLRHQKDIAGIGRSWVDEILWEARLSPFKKGSELDDGGGRAPARRAARARRRDRPLRGDDRPRGPRQGADAAPGPQARGRALPPLRHHDRGRLLLRAPDELLPRRSRPAAACSKTGGSRNCSSRIGLGGLQQEAEVEGGAEWVRAPIEMKSTPVSAIARTVSRSTPPEASSAGPWPRPELLVAQLDRAAQGLEVHVVEQQPVGAGAERVGGLVEVAAPRPRSASSGWALRARVDRLGDAAGEGDVVLLDQDRVVEADAVVAPAAGGDRRLLQRPQARRRLAGVEDAGAGAGDRLDEAGGQGGDAGEVAEEVERGALGDQQRRAPGRSRAAPRPAPPRATAPRRRACRRARPRTGASSPRPASSPKATPGCFLHDPRPRPRSRRHRRLGRHVAAADVLGQRPARRSPPAARRCRPSRQPRSRDECCL